MVPLLVANGIGKSFGARPLFDNLSLAISEGERLGLIGPNGSGKSTLLRILAGAIAPDSGTISVRRQARVGYVAQDTGLPEDRTARDIVAEALAAEPLEEAERASRIHVTLGRAGFTNPDVRAGELSGGWRRRLAIAREVVRKILRDALPEKDLSPADSWLLERALSPNAEDPLGCQLTLKPTLTAIGAPVGTYFPEAARLLNAHLEIPPHAEVANAIGAVVGSVVCRLHIPILPDEEGRLHVHLPDHTAPFAELEKAVAYAEALGRQIAPAQALRAGAENPQITTSRQDHRAPIGQGGSEELWVRTVLEITATGRPRLSRVCAKAEHQGRRGEDV